MSYYGDYIREHRGDGIVEQEEGFATYRFLNAGSSIYVIDIYVAPKYRKTKVASEIADKIVAIGKEAGAKEFLGTVVPSAKNSTVSLRVLLGYGMRLQSATNDLIVFSKEI